MTTIWAELWETVDSLKALSSSGVKLPQEVASTLLGFDALDNRQFAGGDNPQLRRAISYWKAYRDALCNRADAIGPKPIDGASSAVERAA